MAAIGSKRKRFVGEGNDAMRVTSLVKSLVSLPPGKSGARVHPSPGSITSSRLVVQTDLNAERCVAFVASGGGVYRHEVSFAAGDHVVEGKEAWMGDEVGEGTFMTPHPSSRYRVVLGLRMQSPRLCFSLLPHPTAAIFVPAPPPRLRQLRLIRVKIVKNLSRHHE